MRYAEELVDTDAYSFPSATGVRKQELDMAKMLVENLAAEWDPKKYTDDYRANLMKVIKAKMKGKDVHLEPEETPRTGEVVDLMERLRRSLESHGGGRSAKPRAAAPKKAGKKSKRAA
jgi:DNA end-binding protein Ku